MKSYKNVCAHRTVRGEADDHALHALVCNWVGPKVKIKNYLRNFVVLCNLLGTDVCKYVFCLKNYIWNEIKSCIKVWKFELDTKIK